MFVSVKMCFVSVRRALVAGGRSACVVVRSASHSECRVPWNPSCPSPMAITLACIGIVRPILHSTKRRARSRLVVVSSGQRIASCSLAATVREDGNGDYPDDQQQADDADASSRPDPHHLRYILSHFLWRQCFVHRRMIARPRRCRKIRPPSEVGFRSHLQRRPVSCEKLFRHGIEFRVGPAQTHQTAAASTAARACFIVSSNCSWRRKDGGQVSRARLRVCAGNSRTSTQSNAHLG